MTIMMFRLSRTYRNRLLVATALALSAVAALLPPCRIGMAEWGYTSNNPPSNLSTVLQEGYSINPSASLPAGVWAGGVFYWEFGLTAVPRTGNNKLGSPSDWGDVNSDLQNQN